MDKKAKKLACNRLGRWLDAPKTDAEASDREQEIRSLCAEIRAGWSDTRWEHESGYPPVEIMEAHCEYRLLERFD